MALSVNVSQALATNTEILIFDRKEKSSKNFPDAFRDLSEFDLNAIASAQFSENELQEIRKKYPGEKILIVDLRREPHGMINGEAVSWREKFNKSESNSGKKNSEIIADEKLRLNAAKKNSEILVNRVVAKDKQNGWFKEVQPQIVAAQEVSTEEDLAKKYGFKYRRIAVQDHAKPEPERLDEMVNLIKNLPADEKIYVHCAAGQGRTTTFLALYDIIKNGDKLSLEAILERQHKAGGGKLYESDDEEKDEYRSMLAKERLELIKKFYDQRDGAGAENKSRSRIF